MRFRRTGRAKRGRRTRGQRLTLVLSSCLVVGMVATAAGIGYAYSKYSRLSRIELGSVLTERVSSSEPQNILLVGVDSAANLAPDNPARQGREIVGGLRSDTMMILRVEPGSSQARLLSLPRDLWVPLASGGRQRINTAIQIGGPSELIDTIEGYLGIPINHYVQVDFEGFRGLVDVIGGVEVWFDAPTRDRQSGLNVEATGCVSLDPDQALAYVRARHLQTLENGRWRTDGTGDLGRMSRQQDFIMRALRRAVERGVRNPVTLDNLVDAALDTVTVDDLLTAEEIVELATQFRSFQPERLERYALPVVDGSVGGAAILRLVDDDAQPVLDLFRGVASPEPGDQTSGGEQRPVVPSTVRVQVLNGSGVTGQAGDASAALAAAGFVAADPSEAESFGFDRTVLRYAPGQAAAADLVARHLVVAPVLEEVAGDLGADVVVVTGADFEGVTLEPRPGTTSTTSSGPGFGETTSTTALEATSTTSTTVVGKVPEPPPGSGC